MSCDSSFLCASQIYDRSSHRKRLLAVKKEKGHTFETDPEYKRLTNCLSEDIIYKSQSQCDAGPKTRKKRASKTSNTRSNTRKTRASKSSKSSKSDSDSSFYHKTSGKCKNGYRVDKFDKTLCHKK